MSETITEAKGKPLRVIGRWKESKRPWVSRPAILDDPRPLTDREVTFLMVSFWTRDMKAPNASDRRYAALTPEQKALEEAYFAGAKAYKVFREYKS